MWAVCCPATDRATLLLQWGVGRLDKLAVVSLYGQCVRLNFQELNADDQYGHQKGAQD